MADDETPQEEPKEDKPISRKRRAAKTARNTFIAIIVMLLLIAGGGAAYTYLAGGEVAPAADVLPATTQKPISFIPPKPKPGAQVGAVLQFITTPVRPGDNASMTVKSSPDAMCKIKVVYKKLKSTDDGLIEKMADPYGVVSWTWTVEPNAPEGRHPMEVTCTLHKKSGMVQGILEVKKNAKPL